MDFCGGLVDVRYRGSVGLFIESAHNKKRSWYHKVTLALKAKSGYLVLVQIKRTPGHPPFSGRGKGKGGALGVLFI